MTLNDYLVITYAVGGFAAVVWCVVWSAELSWNPRYPANQKAAICLSVVVFSPAVVPVGLLAAVAYGCWWLAGGFKGLFRHFFPVAASLPKARVHK